MNRGVSFGEGPEAGVGEIGPLTLDPCWPYPQTYPHYMAGKGL